MDVRGDALLIDIAQFTDHLWRQRCNITCRNIRRGLRCILCPGDHDTNSVFHQNPAQGKLRHGDVLGNQAADFLDRFKRNIKRHAGECFALVKFLAIAIKRAVVIGGALNDRQMVCRRYPELVPLVFEVIFVFCRAATKLAAKCV